MRRFTVSLPDEVYQDLTRLCGESVPPSSLQQMIRFAVQSILARPQPENDAVERALPGASTPAATDLLVFEVDGASYGMPIELVETVAAGLEVHRVPSSSPTLVGVAVFRGTLTEVHDGGLVLGGGPLGRTSSLLAVPSSGARVLVTVDTVAGLTHAHRLDWASPPSSAPRWASTLAWNDERVITVVDPRAFNL
jgi:chemotaxis signal transduction protein